MRPQTASTKPCSPLPARVNPIKQLAKVEAKRQRFVAHMERKFTRKGPIDEESSIKLKKLVDSHYSRKLEYWKDLADKYRALQGVYSAARRYAEDKATPRWADLRAIYEVYLLCQETTRNTGILHHVDHIVPLRGKSVCGLHVAWNLQVIPAADNLKKGNKLL